MSPASPTALTAYQRDIWAASSQAPNLPQFNVAGAIRIAGDVDLEFLKECVLRAIQRNDAFHLRFAEMDGVPAQWVEISIPDIEIIDFSEEVDPRAECLGWMERAARRPFILHGGRLFDLALLTEGESTSYLFLAAHHIIVDGWGMDQFARQILADYGRAASGSAPLASAPASYIACVAEEARYRQSSSWQRDRDFFRETFANIAPPLFPIPSSPHSDGTRRSARHSFPIERKVIDRIREEGGSVFAFFTAALSTYLSRVHRCEEVVLGVPFHNRHGMAERRTVGHFANMLPLRVAVHGALAMRDIAAQVDAVTFTTKRHQRLALGDLLQVLPTGGTRPRHLFDVTLSYLRLPSPETVPGLSFEKFSLPHGHDQCALAVHLREYDVTGDVRVDLDYALDVFDENFPIKAAVRHISALLHEAVERPDEPVRDLPMLSAGEYDLLVRTWNATGTVYAQDKTLHGLFEEQAARTPRRVAVAAGASHPALTYAELDAWANQIAHNLRAEGVRPDDRVAVLLERGPELPAVLLGVLKAGGAYVPIDPAYPQERIRFLLQDSGARLVITGSRPHPNADAAEAAHWEADARCLAVDMLRRGPDGPLEAAAGPRDLAYVIYTSGSTGQPKGVMIEHRSVVNRLMWMQRQYPVGDGDVLLHKTPVSFDVSVWELFWWSATGAHVVLLAPGGEKDPQDILRTVAEQRVTVVHFVPSMLGPLLDLLESTPGLADSVSHLRLVFCSGEVLPPGHVLRFHRLFAGRRAPAPRIVNLYGPTEATVDVSHAELYPGTTRDLPFVRVPIGRPIDNTRLYVLGQNGEPQPIGAPGELCVAGAGLARGYLDCPELTREKFVEDPFRPGERMYRTGDLARWLADGAVEYLGRLDEQVKIRGHRVEPGEVQSRLATFPGVRDAVAAAHTSPSRGTYLVGYYVADETVDPGSLRAHLAAVLPEFMIPAHFMRLDRMPLTPNGKADIRALPAPANTDTAGGATGVRGEAETVLAAVWCDVLERHSVGVHENFFALGGDSILMLRVHAESAKRGLHFTLNDIYRYPTLAELARHASLEPRDPAVTAPPEPFALVPGADLACLAAAEDAHPVTRLQLGMLYPSREHEQSAVYHDVFRCTLEIDWEEVALRQAHGLLVARHPVLRSSFDLTGTTQPLQIVHRPADAGESLEIADLRCLTAEAAEAAVREHIEQRRFHRYDFARPPLWLLRIHVMPSRAVDAVFSFHHALLDGWSVANRLQELLRDYLHIASGITAPVADDPIPSFAIHARDEQRALASTSAREYWNGLFGGAAPGRLETLCAHEAHAGTGFSVLHAVLPERLTEAARSFAHNHGLSLKSVLFATHCLTLRLFQDTDEVTTGLVTHGRPKNAGAVHIAGLFLNTVPVRLGSEARTWLEAVRETALGEQGSHPHRVYPLSAIQAQRGGERVLQSAFNYVNFHILAPILSTAGLRLRDAEVWEQTDIPLLVNAITDPRDGSLILRIDCDGEAFTASQAGIFARRYVDILRRVVTCPGEEPSFGFLTEEPSDVVQQFERQARYTPRAVAITMSGEQWTYEELDRAADRVARRLIHLGLSPGARVAIAMDRSLEMIAVVLGIAKAGAACVPLDVSCPRERIAAMCAQARPFRIIVHSHHAHLVPRDLDILLVESALEAYGRDPEDSDLPALPSIDLDGTAYVLFTSGSTGRPKAVAMPHRALANLVTWQNQAASGALGGTTLQFAPLSFDVSFQEIFSTLCGGGTLLLVSEERRRNMIVLLRLLDHGGVERVFLPYAVLRQLAEAADTCKLYPRRLRVLVTSGEQLRITEEIRRLCAALPDCLLDNQYGPTETHVATSFPMTGDPACFPDLPPVGRPIGGVEVHVLDADMRPVPEGGRGEIYIGGECLAQGYEGLPELTMERFVPHPLRAGSGRLYRTGDLGRMLPGGDLVCLGRVDDQVKIRGFRVEPAEAELALGRLAQRFPGLRDIAVVARQLEDAPAFLTAFLTGDEASVDVSEIRRRLRASLPEHLVPTRFTWVPEIPHTPSGKRDDVALRMLPLDAPVPSLERTGPGDDYERGLSEVLSELLRVAEPGVLDDFFELGGTSLTAMRLVTMIEKRYGTHVPLSAFAEAPTIAALASRLRREGARTSTSPLVMLRTTGTRPPLFFVHPIGGNVLCYARLAQYLPEGRPVYALQAAGAEPGAEPLQSVPDLAHSYLDAIRTVQPSGPYSIGGWSFGGLVAFEMARQMKSTGEAVDRLVLLDSITPGTAQEVTEDQLLEWFLWELLRIDGDRGVPVPVLPSGLSGQRLYEYARDRAVEAGVLALGTSAARVRRLFHVFRANWRALLTYCPDRCDQDLSLLRATSPLPKALEPAHRAVGSRHRDPANGWGDWTSGQVDVIDVPGDHLQLMEEPHIATVARCVGEVTG